MRCFLRRARRAGQAASLLLTVLVPALAVAAPNAKPGPYLEDLTWTELRDRVHAGTTTVLVPIGGTEQSGPHMALGKHNVRARLLAGQIAERLGNALVAPTVAYVPEGAIDPPASHMRFPGTISIPDAAFEATLESAARSFCRHGLSEVVLLGDHGGYQKSLERVAARFERAQTAKSACHVHALTEYYRVTQTAFVDALRVKGFKDAEIGTHAGLADTALSLALDPGLVRQDALPRTLPSLQEGVYGDPRRATAELGRIGVTLIVDASVKAIRILQGGAPQR